jgi:hypothetical protein
VASKRTATGAPAALEFEATLVGVKPVIAKKDQWGQGSAGKLEVTFSIPQPDSPKKPRPGWQLQGNDPRSDKIAARPADLTDADKKKGEAEKTFGERKARVLEEQKNYDRQLTQYQADMKRFERQVSSSQGRLIAYAQLVGLAAVFGNQDLRVVVHPKTSLLEGFGVQLLAAPDEDDAIDLADDQMDLVAEDDE